MVKSIRMMHVLLLPSETVSSFRYELSYMYYTLILCVNEQLRLVPRGVQPTP